MKQKAVKYKKYGEVGVMTISDEVENFQAKLALQFISRWGMIAGIDDGEDSSGRAKSRLLSPEEVVKRAFDTAEAATKEIEKRNMWLKIEEKEEDND